MIRNSRQTPYYTYMLTRLTIVEHVELEVLLSNGGGNKSKGQMVIVFMPKVVALEQNES